MLNEARPAEENRDHASSVEQPSLIELVPGVEIIGIIGIFALNQ